MPKTILITGANRGLGLEFVKQYAKDDQHILACCRDLAAATELQQLANAFPNIQIEKLDVANDADIRSIATKLAGMKIDLLINNAAIIGDGDKDIHSLPIDTVLKVFEVNVLSPLKMSQALYSNIAASSDKLIITISSIMGSIGNNNSGGRYPYRISKAALNMAMKNVSIDSAKDGVKVLTLHPGWVQTDMGGQEAPLTPEESIKGMRQVISQAQRLKSGGFYDYLGEEIGW